MTSNRPLGERLCLTVITDPGAKGGVVEVVRAAIEAGAPSIQLRWKNGTSRQMVELATELREMTRRAGAMLLVNDRLDVALAANADGVHLGDDDIPLEAARRVAPAGFIIGRSVDTADEARAAESGGADYVGAGPVYATASKLNTGPVVGVEGIRRICQATRLPVVGVGGVGSGGAGAVIRAGARGVAVIGAVMNEDDAGAATRALMAEVCRPQRGEGSG